MPHLGPRDAHRFHHHPKTITRHPPQKRFLTNKRHNINIKEVKTPNRKNHIKCIIAASATTMIRRRRRRGQHNKPHQIRKPIKIIAKDINASQAKCEIAAFCTVADPSVGGNLNTTTLKQQMYSTLRGKTDKLEEAVNREVNVTRS